MREHPWPAPRARVCLWWRSTIGRAGELLEGQAYASMLRCTSNASARVVMCGSFCVAFHVSVYVDNQSIKTSVIFDFNFLFRSLKRAEPPA